MSRVFTLAVLVTLTAVFSWGCTSSDAPPAADHAHGDDVHAHADAAGKICGSCGEEKGTENCCNESAEKCENCGKNKGSLLCCVELDESAAGKDLCSKCGHVAGSDACCADGAEACDKCGLTKGAPLCCKLQKEEDTAHAPEE